MASVPELQRRLVFALLRPAVRVCRRFRIPLDVIEQLARLAYYEELRAGGATQVEVAEILGKSIRTVVNVERLARSGFMAPEDEVRLARHLEEVLAEGPQSTVALAARLDHTEAEVERAVLGLVGAGRARATETGFVLAERFQSLVQDDIHARLVGLEHQLEVMTASVVRRFFGASDGRPTAARTLSFVGTAADVQGLADELIRTLRLKAVDVEERALEVGGYDRYGVTFAVAPADPERTPKDR